MQIRINQASFRDRVLRAHRSCCALCRLKHVELLDAAHIRPHAEGGLAVVKNGLSLCKIHHAAYDANLLGIRPELVAEIRVDVPDERDGPMLAHGLQAPHGATLLRPRSPSRPRCSRVPKRTVPRRIVNAPAGAACSLRLRGAPSLPLC